MLSHSPFRTEEGRESCELRAVAKTLPDSAEVPVASRTALKGGKVRNRRSQIGYIPVLNS